MKHFKIIVFAVCLLFCASPGLAIPPSPPSSSGSVGTVTNTKWCVGDAGGLVQCTQDAPAGTGDMLADGSVPFTGVVETPGVEVKNGADSSGFVDFYEDSSNGTSYFRLYGPEALAGNVFFQLPPTSGTTGGQLYFSSANKLAVAGAGTEGQLWIMGAAIPAWTAVPTWNQNTTGNASTSTALAADPTNCNAGSYPLGVDASGNAEYCTAISYPTQASLHIDSLITLSGVADDAVNLGSFTGSTITPDTLTIKEALQTLETAVETKADTSSLATYTPPTGNALVKKTGEGTIGTSYIVTAGPTADRTITFDDAAQTVAARDRDNTFTSANTFGDGGDDQRLVMRINATNERWSGNTLYFAQCAASLAFGTPVYIQSTGKPAGADADAAATMPAIGLIVVASTDADTPCTVLTHGTITDTDWNFTTVGATIYTSETAGSVELDVANLSDTNDVVQVLGIALHADTLFVNPSLVTIVLE